MHEMLLKTKNKSINETLYSRLLVINLRFRRKFTACYCWTVNGQTAKTYKFVSSTICHALTVSIYSKYDIIFFLLGCHNSAELVHIFAVSALSPSLFSPFTHFATCIIHTWKNANVDIPLTNTTRIYIIYHYRRFSTEHSTYSATVLA